jgi:hypothetical protein
LSFYLLPQEPQILGLWSSGISNLIDRHQYFAGVFCLHIQSEDGGSISSNTVGPIYQTTGCHIPEDNDLGTHCHRKLKSLKFHVFGHIHYKNVMHSSNCFKYIYFMNASVNEYFTRPLTPYTLGCCSLTPGPTVWHPVKLLFLWYITHIQVLYINILIMHTLLWALLITSHINLFLLPSQAFLLSSISHYIYTY